MQQNIKLSFILIFAAVLLIACGAESTATPYPSEVDWNTAIEILNTGEVEQVFQLHNLDVTFYMKDGQQIETIEPNLDDIFDEVEKCGAPCSNIMLATE